MTTKTDKVLFWKFTKVIVPSIFVALSIFFVHNWESGLATKNDLLTSYASKAEIKEMHDDVKLLLFGMATMHPELRVYFLKTAQNPVDFLPPEAPKPEKPIRLADGG